MEPEAEESGPVDPFADLLFTLIAAVLPAILVLIPAMHLTRTAAPPAEAPEIRVEGVRAAVLVAEAAGLRWAGRGSDGRSVPLDAIGDDPDLRARLRRAGDGGEPLLLVVAPDGLEAAFLLEPVLAAEGAPRVQQVRAAPGCEPALAALAPSCAAPAGGRHAP